MPCTPEDRAERYGRSAIRHAGLTRDELQRVERSTARAHDELRRRTSTLISILELVVQDDELWNPVETFAVVPKGPASEYLSELRDGEWSELISTAGHRPPPTATELVAAMRRILQSALTGADSDEQTARRQIRDARVRLRRVVALLRDRVAIAGPGDGDSVSSIANDAIDIAIDVGGGLLVAAAAAASGIPGTELVAQVLWGFTGRLLARSAKSAYTRLRRRFGARVDARAPRISDDPVLVRIVLLLDTVRTMRDRTRAAPRVGWQAPPRPPDRPPSPVLDIGEVARQYDELRELMMWSCTRLGCWSAVCARIETVFVIENAAPTRGEHDSEYRDSLRVALGLAAESLAQLYDERATAR